MGEIWTGRGPGGVLGDGGQERYRLTGDQEEYWGGQEIYRLTGDQEEYWGDGRNMD